ncbi:hypothetical protein HPB52_011173 [Rhipicephalus sanguineus]|uniref:Uncharacterized protein n=1 Tax=Rhipicephalus sanguineus TaxID=34632 RepID=A0A9D4T0H8_RHISA|nr:hypothetical protein HPB52_011173 [Rhipicephalus sanguineus]
MATDTTRFVHTWENTRLAISTCGQCGTKKFLSAVSPRYLWRSAYLGISNCWWETSSSLFEAMPQRTILAVRKLGDSTAAVVTFEGTKLHRFIFYHSFVAYVRPYKKIIPACSLCGTIGHRPSVCPRPTPGRCTRGGTQVQMTPEGLVQHECNTTCLICSGPHETADCTLVDGPASGFPSQAWITSQHPGDPTAGHPKLASLRKQDALLQRQIAPPTKQFAALELQQQKPAGPPAVTPSAEHAALNISPSATATPRIYPPTPVTSPAAPAAQGASQNLNPIDQTLPLEDRINRLPDAENAPNLGPGPHRGLVSFPHQAFPPDLIPTGLPGMGIIRPPYTAIVHPKHLHLYMRPCSGSPPLPPLGGTPQHYPPPSGPFHYPWRNPTSAPPRLLCLQGPTSQLANDLCDRYHSRTVDPMGPEYMYSGLPSTGLEAPFTLPGLRAALAEMKPGTAPGRDDITVTLLANLPDSAHLSLLHLINEVWKGAPLPAEWTTSVVTIIPKPGTPISIEASISEVHSTRETQ